MLTIQKNTLSQEKENKRNSALQPLVEEKDDTSLKVDMAIRENGISLSQECAVLRETVKFLLDKLGYTFEKFDTHNAKVEEIKKQVLENQPNKEER